MRELANRTGARPDWAIEDSYIHLRYKTLEAALEALDDALEHRDGIWRERLEHEVG